MTFTVTAHEQSAGILARAKLDAIRSEVETRGYAVVGGLIGQDICGLLEASILEDAASVRALNSPTRHEQVTGQGHLQLGLRRCAPYVRAELVANPIIEQVTAAILGSGAWLGFYNGNVNLPGSVHQPLHFDRPFSWRTKEKAEQDGQPWPPPTTTLSCSLALTEISEDNGATEVYPGTHHETAVTQWSLEERISNHPDLIERWGPPQHMIIPAGGVCFRDPRMWHRGVPNPGDTTRPLIALTYHAQRCLHWRGRLVKNMTPADLAACEQDPTLRVMDNGRLADGRLLFEENAASAFNQTQSLHGINRNVRFVDDSLKVNHFLDAHLVGGARVVANGALDIKA